MSSAPACQPGLRPSWDAVALLPFWPPALAPAAARVSVPQAIILGVVGFAFTIGRVVFTFTEPFDSVLDNLISIVVLSSVLAAIYIVIPGVVLGLIAYWFVFRIWRLRLGPRTRARLCAVLLSLWPLLFPAIVWACFAGLLEVGRSAAKIGCPQPAWLNSAWIDILGSWIWPAVGLAACAINTYVALLRLGALPAEAAETCCSFCGGDVSRRETCAACGREVVCHRCSYSRVGLDPASKCPECGHAP